MTQQEHDHMVTEFMERIDTMVRIVIMRAGVNPDRRTDEEIDRLKAEAAQILLRLTAPF